METLARYRAVGGHPAGKASSRARYVADDKGNSAVLMNPSCSLDNTEICSLDLIARELGWLPVTIRRANAERRGILCVRIAVDNKH